MQDLGVDQGVDRVRRRPAADARDLRGGRQGGVIAEDRQRPRDRPGRRRARRSRAATKQAN